MLVAHFERNIADYGKIAGNVPRFRAAAGPRREKEAVIRKVWLLPFSRRLMNRIAYERRWPEPREATSFWRQKADRKAYERRRANACLPSGRPPERRLGPGSKFLLPGVGAFYPRE